MLYNWIILKDYSVAFKTKIRLFTKEQCIKMTLQLSGFTIL